MRLSSLFELMQISDEYMAVPVGNKADAFHGIVALSEPAYFLLTNMKEPKTREELVKLITEEYEVDAAVAAEDIDRILATLLETGVIDE